ncbi:hypothetical protein TD95_000787 [Thielaviopsis punctulata]|uniref:Arylsulfatase n=1 Tax=Thielaviopsis punctulata TaxID=72032 RepID=A0A0F4ZM66_9PEZI|nr:hypothetical protein TD95_000787 [Thielaviopsis punctulata]
MKAYNSALTALTLLSAVAATAADLPDAFQAPLIPGLSLERSLTDQKPNIVFILTDDQDKHMDSLKYMPLLHKYLAENGTSYQKHFCTTAVCCPSRTSLWTGKLAHNTNVTDVSPPYGGYPKFVSQGFNDAYLPVWLQKAGYNTYYTGKLFNSMTIDNYNAPYPAGWNGTDFLLDPYTYLYFNATYQANHDAPKSYPGQYTTDVITEKALSLLSEAASAKAPFFVGIAPVAPHGELVEAFEGGARKVKFNPPVPAPRHAHLFPDAVVPRTPNFNPSVPSGGSWQRLLPELNATSIAYNDYFYLQRLRALQSVDELVAAVVDQLDRDGLLDNTYVIYSSDNGFHISQHRLQPGKTCAIEEDINVPLIIRGPNVPANVTAEMVTTHIDLAPTLLRLAGALNSTPAVFDGVPVPLSAKEQAAAKGQRHEHVTVEYWGRSIAEGKYATNISGVYNTYKSVRIVAADESYSLSYTVWCDGSHELYDMITDAYQMANLFGRNGTIGISGITTSLAQLTARLDALLLVLKTCVGHVCTQPWDALHPHGNVRSLKDALSKRFDAFYAAQPKVAYEYCAPGYILSAEGPQFSSQDLLYRDGVEWHHWT